MAELNTLSEKRELEITITALREYHDRRYKLYKANNNMPVTDEEFEALKEKAREVREIKFAIDDFESQLKELVESEHSKDESTGGK